MRRLDERLCRETTKPIKDDSAMPWKITRRRLLSTAFVMTVLFETGCQRIPYIDQSRVVPSDDIGVLPEEDRQVRQAVLMEDTVSQLPTPLPDLAPPRTTDQPEADEIWELTLQDAIQLGLENSEVIRVISLGAQGIPIGGFEPTPLNTGAGGGISSALGAGALSTVYDPAIQETQIAQALSTFDTTFTTSLFWGKNVQPFNNSIAAGFFSSANRVPVIFDQKNNEFKIGLQKRTATGATLNVAHNINMAYSNSPQNVYPSAYTANTQLRLSQPLLGGSDQFGPSGLEANRAPIVIARVNADAAVWRFKADVMAMVRSVEQQYWALSQQQVQLWSRETAIGLGEQIVRREQSRLEVGRGSQSDVAEAEQRLEGFRLQLISATADVITTERQLRNILGLPPTDNRRIIPVTAPTEARMEPDWELSLAQMIAFQPDIVQQQLQVRLAELQLLVARNRLLPVLNFDALYQLNGYGNNIDDAEAVMTGQTIKAIDPLNAALQQQAGLQVQPGNYSNFQTWQLGLTFQAPLGFRGPLASVKASQYILLRQRAYLQQIVHQQTHSLARFFLEVDANYKLFKTAGRNRLAASTRLEAQRAEYEVGRVPIDRYLEAVAEWANAVAQEAQFKTSYNTSIAALEEAKGTLLAYNNVAVEEGPQPAKAYLQARDLMNQHGRIPSGGSGPSNPSLPVGPAMPDAAQPIQIPGVQPRGDLPPFPAPVGPASRPANPIPPAVPAGEPDYLSENPGSANDPADRMRSRDAALIQTSSGSASGPPSNLPPLP
jgi:outer membrane protein TolC